MRYIFYWNLQFLNNIIIIKSWILSRSRSWPSLIFVYLVLTLSAFGFPAPKDF
jgi:hypothetical protein